LQSDADDYDSRIHYPTEVDCAAAKPEVTFYPQGSSTPSSTSVASGKTDNVIPTIHYYCHKWF
jgi:hypothetical protein